MLSQSTLERFKLSKAEMTKLGSEFKAEAIPLLGKLYNTSFWILLNKKAASKIINQTFFEAIDNCNVTKNSANWDEWIYRIWMREILDYYSKKENDTQTIFDFIDQTEISLNEVVAFIDSTKILSGLSEDELLKSLNKLPAVLRIPMMMKEISSFNYEKISEVLDVPVGVTATRIYRARKLFYLFMSSGFNYDKQKGIGIQPRIPKLIFELRLCASLVDDELGPEQKISLSGSMTNSNLYEAEILVQRKIKKLFEDVSSDNKHLARIRAKIASKAIKRFGQLD